MGIPNFMNIFISEKKKTIVLEAWTIAITIIMAAVWLNVTYVPDTLLITSHLYEILFSLPNGNIR